MLISTLVDKKFRFKEGSLTDNVNFYSRRFAETDLMMSMSN